MSEWENIGFITFDPVSKSQFIYFHPLLTNLRDYLYFFSAYMHCLIIGFHGLTRECRVM
jgi:hypothetical protein